MNKPARILIIEDNAANLELMRYLLAAFGFELLTARDGAEGLAAAAAHPPELILCDIQMPGIDGYEVLRRLRADAALARVPVLAVTALAMVGDRDKTLAAGFDGYLSKPIDPMAFVQQVQAYLPPGSRTDLANVPRTAPSPLQASSEPRATILAVDNHQTNLDLVASLFEASGYRVVATVDSREAVSLARQHAPDLILSDVCMPKGSGFELVRAFKDDAQLRAIPFVLITSTVANETERKRGLALGAEKFLFRPIEPQELLKEVELCLQRPETA